MRTVCESHYYVRIDQKIGEFFFSLARQPIQKFDKQMEKNLQKSPLQKKISLRNAIA